MPGSRKDLSRPTFRGFLNSLKSLNNSLKKGRSFWPKGGSCLTFEGLNLESGWGSFRNSEREDGSGLGFWV